MRSLRSLNGTGRFRRRSTPFRIRLLGDWSSSADRATTQLNDMRVAIVHHWFITRAGGERVFDTIASIFPDR